MGKYISSFILCVCLSVAYTDAQYIIFNRTHPTCGGSFGAVRLFTIAAVSTLNLGSSETLGSGASGITLTGNTTHCAAKLPSAPDGDTTGLYDWRRLETLHFHTTWRYAVGLNLVEQGSTGTWARFFRRMYLNRPGTDSDRLNGLYVALRDYRIHIQEFQQLLHRINMLEQRPRATTTAAPQWTSEIARLEALIQATAISRQQLRQQLDNSFQRSLRSLNLDFIQRITHVQRTTINMEMDIMANINMTFTTLINASMHNNFMPTIHNDIETSIEDKLAFSLTSLIFQLIVGIPTGLGAAVGVVFAIKEARSRSSRSYVRTKVIRDTKSVASLYYALIARERMLPRARVSYLLVVQAPLNVAEHLLINVVVRLAHPQRPHDSCDAVINIGYMTRLEQNAIAYTCMMAIYTSRSIKYTMQKIGGYVRLVCDKNQSGVIDEIPHIYGVERAGHSIVVMPDKLTESLTSGFTVPDEPLDVWVYGICITEISGELMSACWYQRSGGTHVADETKVMSTHAVIAQYAAYTAQKVPGATTKLKRDAAELLSKRPKAEVAVRAGTEAKPLASTGILGFESTNGDSSV